MKAKKGGEVPANVPDKVPEKPGSEFAGLIEIFKKEIKGENGKKLKPKEVTALRNEEVSNWFGEKMQMMLLDGILKSLAEAGQEVNEPVLRELQTKLLNARSSNDLMPWPVKGLGGQDYYQKFLDDKLAEGKKAMDNMSEMMGSVAKGAIASAKMFVAVAELMDGAKAVIKDQGITFLKGDLPNLISLKVLEKVALMEKTLLEATKGLTETDMRDAVKSIIDGLKAVEASKKKPEQEGGTRGRKRRRRTQRYRARFREADFF